MWLSRMQLVMQVMVGGWKKVIAAPCCCRNTKACTGCRRCAYARWQTALPPLLGSSEEAGCDAHARRCGCQDQAHMDQARGNGTWRALCRVARAVSCRVQKEGGQERCRMRHGALLPGCCWAACATHAGGCAARMCGQQGAHRACRPPAPVSRQCQPPPQPRGTAGSGRQVIGRCATRHAASGRSSCWLAGPSQGGSALRQPIPTCLQAQHRLRRRE